MIVYFNDTALVSHEVADVFDIDAGVKASHLQVVMFKGHQVRAPLGLIHREHAIRLHLNAVVCDPPVVASKQFIQLEFLSLSAKRSILNTVDICTDFIERLHIFVREFSHVPCRHTQTEKSFLGVLEVAIDLRVAETFVNK